MAAEARRYPNIVGCYVGRKHKNGRLTRTVSLVCIATKKIGAPAAADAIPTSFAWRDPDGTQRRLGTDVTQLVGIQYETGQIAGPGDVVKRSNGEVATMGIVIDHPLWGRVVTTAGHLFLNNFMEPESVTITCTSVPHTGLALRRRLTSRSDYALVQIPHVVSDNLYLDQYPLRATYQPTHADIGTGLQVLTSAGAPINVTCRGISGQFTIDGRPMQDLILTDWRTQPGHSGSCLMDEQQRAWGLLVGRVDLAEYSLSAFAPAHVVLFEENAKFVYGE